MKKELKRITQPMLSHFLTGRLGDDIVLSGRSLELMYEIQKLMSVLEPIADDETRSIWLEVPKGTAIEWQAAGKLMPFGYPAEIQEYEAALKEDYQYEKQWVTISVGTYRDFTSLKITDRYSEYRIFCNEDRSSESVREDGEWFLVALLSTVRTRMTEILRDPDAFNRYIENALPYCQRQGRIKSSDLNRILPSAKFTIPGQARALKDLRKMQRMAESYKKGYFEGLPQPFEQITIRLFCKYYRIADEAFVSYGRKRKRPAVSIDDLKYYTRHGSLDGFDVDSPEDFEKLALDHYGELGLSRMNVRATDYYTPGKWLITFDISYSMHAELGLRIARALLRAGAQLVFNDATSIINMLQEQTWMRLGGFTFHDYLQGDDDAGIMDLPFPEDCGQNGEITREQYDAITQAAQWEPQNKMIPDRPVPLSDSVYSILREDGSNCNEISDPMTISQIRHKVEAKLGTYLGVYYDEDYYGYFYYYFHKDSKSFKTIKSEQLYPTFNQAMKALILRYAKS